MVSIEYVRVAGNIADALEFMGFTPEQMVDIANLLKKQALVRKKHTPEETLPGRPGISTN